MYLYLRLRNEHKKENETFHDNVEEDKVVLI
jgi:hypothetical protein